MNHVDIYQRAASPSHDQMFIDWSLLFRGIRGKLWLLTANAVSVVGGTAKANLFSVSGGQRLAVAVVAGGSATTVTVKLSPLKGLQWCDVERAEAIVPGAAAPVKVSIQADGSIAAKISRGAVLIVLHLPTASGLSIKADDEGYVLPDDMSMLRDAGRTDGPPPPACPPHCAKPIPRCAELNCTFQLMKELSSTEHIEDFNRSGSYLCAPVSAAAKAGPGAGKLLLFFTGTAPSDNTLFVQTAAALGYHAIALSYNNIVCRYTVSCVLLRTAAMLCVLCVPLP